MTGAAAFPRERSLVDWTSSAMTKAALVAGIIVSDFWSGGVDPWLTPLLIVCVLAWESPRLASVRNVIIAYHALVLGAGPYVVAGVDVDVVHEFGFGVGLAFLVGLTFGRVRPVRGRSVVRGGVNTSPTTLLWIPAVMQSVVIVVDIALIGPQAYFGAGTQVAGIRTYADGGLGAQQILKLALDVATTGFVAAYVALRFGRGALHWRLLTVLLVLMPLLRLERGAVVVNLLALMLLYQLVAPSTRRRVMPVSLVIILPLIMAGVGIGLGAVREATLNSSGRANSPIVAAGEFSPVIVVDAALREDPRYGSEALWGAMTTRFLPRKWFPNKVQNSTERYMRSHDSASLAAGFSLAPTALGALMLVYGWFVTAMLVFIAGIFLGANRRTKSLSDLSVGLTSVTYFTIYPLMRNDPVNSITQFLLTATFFVVVYYAVRVRGAE